MPCYGATATLFTPDDQSQVSRPPSEELDPVLLGRLPPEHRALPLPLQYPQRPPQQPLVGPLERHPVHVLPRVELVQRADAVDVPVRGRPVVQVGRELLRPPPENADAGLHRGVLPLAVAAVDEVVGDGGDVPAAELAADRVVPPQGTVVKDERLDLQVGVCFRESSVMAKWFVWG